MTTLLGGLALIVGAYLGIGLAVGFFKKMKTATWALVVFGVCMGILGAIILG